MDNSVTFDLNLNVIGGSEVSKLPAKIQSVGDAAESVGASLNPLAKIIQLLETTNKILHEIGKVCVASFNKMDDMANIAQDGFHDTVTEVERLNSHIKGLKKSSGEAGASIKESLFDKIGGVGQKLIGIKSIAASFMDTLSPIFAEGMARETAAANFGTLLGDAQAGSDYAETLRSTDAAALYGTGTLNQNAQQMLAYGVDSGTTLEVLKSIGDIAMGDANKMSSLATAFSQMSSLGKLQSQDWKQMVGAGFNPFIQMQKDLGKTAEELDTMMSKGQITADMVKDAFINATKEGGQFAGALENVMDNTLQGKIAQFKGLWDDLKAKIFDLIKPLAEKLLPVAGKLIEKLESFSPVMEGLMAILGPVMDWIAGSIDELYALAVAVGVVAAAVWALNSPVLLIAAAVGILIYVVVEVMKAFDDWGAAVSLLMGPLGTIVIIVQTIRRYWDDIVSAFESDGIMGALSKIGLCIHDMLLYPVQQLLGWIGEITGWEWAKSAKGFVEEYRKSIGAIDPVKNVASESESQDVDLMARLTAAVNGNAGGGQGSASLASATGKGKESVASGGARNTSINITLSSLVETIAFNGTLEESSDDMESKVAECLQRVLYSAASAV